MRILYNHPILKDRRRALRREETEAEKILWSHLRNKRLSGYRFVRQYSVGPYILDFYCPDVRLAVELDGGQHMAKDAEEYDRQRTGFLQAHDVRVIRFWNNDTLNNREAVLARILEACSVRIPLNRKNKACDRGVKRRRPRRGGCGEGGR